MPGRLTRLAAPAPRAAALAAALLLAPSLAPAPARAAVFEQVSVEAVARDADAVVRGRVVASAARFGASGRRIVTESTVEVDEAWKGAPARRVTVVTPGGRVGDLAQRTEGAAALAPGEEVVLFLVARGDVFAVAAHAAGKFTVEGGLARPSLEGIVFQPSPLRASERLVGDMTVDELRARVEAAR